MDQSSKLKKFEAAVYAEIDTKTELIKHEAEDFKNSELEKNKDLQLAKAYAEIQKQSQEVKKKFKRDIAKFGLDAKRTVLIKRSEITQQVFGNVSDKLLEFYNSPSYDEYIVIKLKKSLDSNSLSDVTIYVGEKDYLNKQKLMDVCSTPCTFVEDKSIKLGGFIIKDTNHNIYFDETLTNILAEQKEYFIQNSELFI